MSEATLPTHLHLGFLTVFAEPTGYLGGYLVTNSWGRPLEFRLSTAVQPNKVQQILYAGTLTEYLCADLIGRTLVEKTGIPPHLLVTDSVNVLPLRSRVDVPVVAAVPAPPVADAPGSSGPGERSLATFSHPRSSVPLTLDLKWAGDEEHV